MPRAGYDAELYMQVTSTLYRYYGLIGGPIQVLAFILAVGLLVHTRSTT